VPALRAVAGLRRTGQTGGVPVAGSTTYWRAVALLRLDRRRGLTELERCFASGLVPSGLRGPLHGRLLATTVGHGTDPLFEGLARAWMPWRGKTFDERRAEGRNLFSPVVRRMLRVTLPGYRDVRDEGSAVGAFRFLTSAGPSALDPAVEVLRIDYRAVTENPEWPIRRVLDELVAVDDGLFLGQALLLWRGELRRAAWFALEAQPKKTSASA
jgi:hypothetical protein